MNERRPDMPRVSAGKQGMVGETAERYGVSPDAVLTVLAATQAGGGRQAQFSHPELGGVAQWSQGGMVMIGHMFNSGLKAPAAALCEELSAWLGRTRVSLPRRPSCKVRLRANPGPASLG